MKLGGVVMVSVSVAGPLPDRARTEGAKSAVASGGTPETEN
jgi:hypothetical protein